MYIFSCWKRVLKLITMKEKLRFLRNILEGMSEGISEIQIIRLQGIFNALLIRKIYQNEKVMGIEVKCLKNSNPEYMKGEIIYISLNDGGLIEIKQLNL